MLFGSIIMLLSPMSFKSHTLVSTLFSLRTSVMKSGCFLSSLDNSKKAQSVSTHSRGMLVASRAMFSRRYLPRFELCSTMNALSLDKADRPCCYFIYIQPLLERDDWSLKYKHSVSVMEASKNWHHSLYNQRFSKYQNLHPQATRRCS